MWYVASHQVSLVTLQPAFKHPPHKIAVLLETTHMAAHCTGSVLLVIHLKLLQSRAQQAVLLTCNGSTRAHMSYPVQKTFMSKVQLFTPRLSYS